MTKKTKTMIQSSMHARVYSVCHSFLNKIVIRSLLLLAFVAETYCVTQYVNGVAVVEENVGNPLVLPCDVTPPLGDTVAVILWYKDHQPRAIYTYDARNSSLGFEQHTPRDPNLGIRAKFRPLPPASLTLSPALTSDTGVYQCRADFANSPSRTTILEALVVAPVDDIKLERITHLNDGETTIMPGSVVTIRLHHTLVMKCCVKGGFPAPAVQWLLNNRTVDAVYSTKKPASSKLKNHMAYAHRVTCNELTLANVTRQLDQAQLVCQAVNSNHSKPAVKSVITMVNSPPASVAIIDVPEAFEAERLYRITCEVSGSRPRPLLTWTVTRVDQTPKVIARQDLRKLSSGRLDIKVSKADEGAVLTCSAVSPSFPDNAMTARHIIKVHYAPIVRLELGALLEPGSVREGTDLYFRCIVDAAPLPYRLDWWHGNNQITNDGLITSRNIKPVPRLSTLHENHGVKSFRGHSSVSYSLRLNSKFDEMHGILLAASKSQLGGLKSLKALKKQDPSIRAQGSGTRVVVSSDHLILQKVTKEWTGNFSCSTNNVVGDAISNAIQIVVQYPPICAWESPRMLRASIGELLQLPCSVLALPHEVSFSWTFSNALSQERITSMTKENMITRNGSTVISSSILEYRPLSQQDFGTVLCWAKNVVGKQKEPCVYTIRPAPEVLSPPPECIVTNHTQSSLQVVCIRREDNKNTSSFENSKNSNNNPSFNNEITTDNKDVKADSVTFSQATRHRGHVKDERNVSVGSQNYNRPFSSKNDGRREETENIYSQPYVTLENKKKHSDLEKVVPSGSRELLQQSNEEIRNSGQTPDTGTARSREDEKGIVLPYFVMSVRERDTNQLIINQTSFSGEFTLTGLTPGVDYRLAVTSVGEKGIRSPPAPLIAATLSRLSPANTNNPQDESSSANVETIICGAVAGLALVIFVLILVILVRRQRRRPNFISHGRNELDNQDSSVQLEEETTNRDGRQTSISSSEVIVLQEDRKNLLLTQRPSTDSDNTTGSLLTTTTVLDFQQEDKDIRIGARSGLDEDQQKIGPSGRFSSGCGSLQSNKVDDNKKQQPTPDLLDERCTSSRQNEMLLLTLRPNASQSHRIQQQAKHGVRFADEVASFPEMAEYYQQQKAAPSQHNYAHAPAQIIAQSHSDKLTMINTCLNRELKLMPGEDVMKQHTSVEFQPQSNTLSRQKLPTCGASPPLVAKPKCNCQHPPNEALHRSSFVKSIQCMSQIPVQPCHIAVSRSQSHSQANFVFDCPTNSSTLPRNLTICKTDKDIQCLKNTGALTGANVSTTTVISKSSSVTALNNLHSTKPDVLKSRQQTVSSSPTYVNSYINA